MTFNNGCYKLLSKIPRGKISTYKEIAKALNTKAYRAVGNAMSKNPNIVLVPCHRIIKNDGSIGGYFSGVNKKVKLLEKEGFLIKNGQVKEFKKHLFQKIKNFQALRIV